MTRLEYIDEYCSYVNQFIASNSPEFYTSNNIHVPSLNVFEHFMVDGSVRSKYDFNSFSSKSTMALVNSINRLYIELNFRLDGATYVPCMHTASYSIGTGYYDTSINNVTNVVATSSYRFDEGSINNDSSYLIKDKVNYNSIGIGDSVLLDYYPATALKYYIDSDYNTWSIVDYSFPYYGYTQVAGATFTNGNGSHVYVYSRQLRYTHYNKYVVDYNLWDNSVLSNNYPSIWSDYDTVFAYLVKDFVIDNEYFVDDNGKYNLMITTSASHFYDYITEKRDKLLAEKTKILAVPTATLLSDAEIVEFFGLKSSFDSAFREYPGIYTSVLLQLGYVTTSDNSSGAIADSSGGLSHVSKIESNFNAIKENASTSTFIKGVEFSDLLGLCTLRYTTAGSYSVGSDVNGNTITVEYTKYVYMLDINKYNNASISLRIIALGLLLGVSIDYEEPCDSDVIAIMIISFLAIAFGAGPAVAGLQAGTFVGVATFAAWAISILLVMGVGSASEQKIMRAYLVVFAMYAAYQMATDSVRYMSPAQVDAAAKSGMYNINQIGNSGLYVMSPTVKAYAYSAASAMSSASGMNSLYQEWKTDNYHVDEASQDELVDQHNKIKFDFLTKKGVMFDPDKKFNDKFEKFDKPFKTNIERNMNGKFL